MLKEHLPVQRVLGFPIAALSFEAQTALMMRWAQSRLSKVVCIANVHMVTEAHETEQFGHVLRSADLITPDGMPLVWMLKLMGAVGQERVAGPDVLSALCAKAPQAGVSVFFLGSQATILDKMRVRLEQEFPSLKIAGMEPLPFRPLTEAEDAEIIQKINSSGAGIVMIALGCPKQEKWMAAHHGKIQAVMIGLGGAFPVYARIYKRPPRMIQMAGLEWLYRLVQEPRRLWKRYFDTMPKFVWLASKQLAASFSQSTKAKLNKVKP
ncbi:MAG: WecB/TagA/CpsF family glycosyltransferase, partial [Leptolyngbyaceae cyanobacterium SM1_3_5]|nr:WecB/TagA/CpsF family glycosyltransferase [Leptolyngbyaceae cyanobacterium SM1_3_5]